MKGNEGEETEPNESESRDIIYNYNLFMIINKRLFIYSMMEINKQNPS